MFRISPREESLQGWFSLASQNERKQTWRSVMRPAPTSFTSLTIISSDSEREAACLGFGHPQVSEEDKITSQWAKPA